MSDSVSLVDINNLDPEFQPRVREVASSIDVNDRQSIVQYGVGAQRRISDFADTILSEVRTKDGGHAGEILGGLVQTIRDVDVNSLSAEPGMFGRVFGGMKRKVARFLQRYESLATQIDTVVRDLEQARMALLRDIATLDSLYEKNMDYLRELDIFIAAGKLKLEEVRSTILPEFEERARNSQDPADAQRLQDLNQLVSRFEKKLHDMQLSRMVAIQTSPQIRLIQSNNETLVEKIQNSVLTTIPLWKNQIVIAVGLFRQKKALELQQKVTDTTNELLKRNAEMLKQGSVDVARESERGIVEIETLQKVNNDLISTIEETLQIQKEGREKRAQAEVELRKMETELKDRLRRVSAEEPDRG